MHCILNDVDDDDDDDDDDGGATIACIVFTMMLPWLALYSAPVFCKETLVRCIRALV